MTSSHDLELEGFADALADGLKAELFLTPKPGLVDLNDSGSHPDLSLELMLRSVGLVRHYLHELAAALQQRAALAELRKIAIDAEQRMLGKLGTNCHRGGIFLTGVLLCAFADCRTLQPELLSAAVGRRAEDFFHGVELPQSNGQQARNHFQAGGIVAETLNGLPGLFQVALPAFSSCADEQTGAFLAMSRLMQSCEDTTTLHRGGQTGLARLCKAGAALEQVILAGQDPFPLLGRLNQDFRSMRLTMGGVADLLGLMFGYLSACESLSSAPGPRILPADESFAENSQPTRVGPGRI